MIKEVDDDGDGEISYREFAKLMTAYFKMAHSA
jgi:Ca2+-binding EF-hand superfamily protein